MQLICFVAVFFVGVTLSPVKADLLYTDHSTDDGPCKDVSPIPLVHTHLNINPVKTYYIPVASENFYRYEYNMATSRPAQSEDEVKSLKTRLYISPKDLLTTGSTISVSFFGGDDVHYSYILRPSLTPSSLPSPIFDVNATAVHGTDGTGPDNFGGVLRFIVIWSDETPAYNLYTCLGGRQMFHIFSANSTLSDEQFETNKKILMDLGMSPDNFQYLKYDD